MQAEKYFLVFKFSLMSHIDSKINVYLLDLHGSGTLPQL
jgi:hypothetical protein